MTMEPEPEKEIEQFALDLDGEKLETRLQYQWACNREKDAHNWTDEAFAMRWVLGVTDWDWWKQFPNYQRENWIMAWQCERDRAIQTGSKTIRTCANYEASMEEHYQERKKLAESWAQDLRAAFLERRPCPIIPAPGNEHILQWAMQIAQTEPANFPPIPEKIEKKRRHEKHSTDPEQAPRALHDPEAIGREQADPADPQKR